MEVSADKSGWSGAQPDGRCICLCLSSLALQALKSTRRFLLAPDYPGSPGKITVKRVCARACVRCVLLGRLSSKIKTESNFLLQLHLLKFLCTLPDIVTLRTLANAIGLIVEINKFFHFAGVSFILCGDKSSLRRSVLCVTDNIMTNQPTQYNLVNQQ